MYQDVSSAAGEDKGVSQIQRKRPAEAGRLKSFN